MTMACILLKTSLIFLVIHQIRGTAALSNSFNSSASLYNTSLNVSSIYTSGYQVTLGFSVMSSSSGNTSNLRTTTTNSIRLTTENLVSSTNTNTSSRNLSTTGSPVSSTTITTTATTTQMTNSTAIKPSSTSPWTSHTMSSLSSTGSGKTKKNGDDSEPKVSLYVWEILACGAGAFVFLLFIIIGILCYQNKTLRKRVKVVGNYSLPIKENGLWIDNQDIPLGQKRASTYNVQDNPVQDNPAFEESEAV